MPMPIAYIRMLGHSVAPISSLVLSDSWCAKNVWKLGRTRAKATWRREGCGHTSEWTRSARGAFVVLCIRACFYFGRAVSGVEIAAWL